MKSSGARTARLLAVAGGVALAIIACEARDSVATKTAATSSSATTAATAGGSDAEASKRAFLLAYSVFMSPRCMNCHPNGDVPLQGDDSHLHTQGVIRGVDGHGVYAMKCSSCHQLENRPGPNMPPGHPKWALPPANMKMVFQGRTPAQLAAQFKDPKQTGKTLDEMVKHVTEDTLVGKGWDPGDGRTLPPLPRDKFAAAFKEWVDKGAAIPD